MRVRIKDLDGDAGSETETTWEEFATAHDLWWEEREMLECFGEVDFGGGDLGPRVRITVLRDEVSP